MFKPDTLRGHCKHLEWNRIPVINGHPSSKLGIPTPKNYETMLKLAAKLSKGIPQVRVDFCNIKGKIYFGELTFFQWSGLFLLNQKNTMNYLEVISIYQ